jgi:hypothetical protein
MKVLAVFMTNVTKQKSMFCGQNAGYCSFKASGTYDGKSKSSRNGGIALEW